MLRIRYRQPCFAVQNYNIMHPHPQAPKGAVKRKLTISNKYFARVQGKFAFFPSIRLSGKWLQQAGFAGGQIIEVTCKQNKLIITLAENKSF